MNYKYYMNAVGEIATAFFDENENYVPHLGKANMIRIYADYFYGEDVAVKKLNEDFEGGKITSFEYVDELYKLLGTSFEKDLKDTSHFSFGCAVQDAKDIVEFEKRKKSNVTELDRFLRALTESVSKVDTEKVLNVIKNKGVKGA